MVPDFGLVKVQTDTGNHTYIHTSILNLRFGELYGHAFATACFGMLLTSMQEVQIEDDVVLADTLAGGGFSPGAEGKLQLAVLILSVMSVATSMLSVWGFVVLRLLGMFYVKTQVRFRAGMCTARLASLP